MDEDLPARIKYWLNEAKHDCFFLVGPEKNEAERIGAMKTFLMGHSEPFRVMLGDSELAETGYIRLKDVEPGTFRFLLKCVYGASSLIIPKLTFEESAKLLYVVDKYLVNDVKPEIRYHMENLLSNNTYDNIHVALSHPICYRTQNLEIKILKTLKYDFDKITKDDKFLDLSDSAISWIIQQDEILVNDIEIWNAVLRWAKHKTGSNDGKILRMYIFDFLKHIRFLTMDIAEFWKDVVPSQILHEEEITDICKAIVLGEPCSIEFLSRSRSCRNNIWWVSENIISSIMKFPRHAFIQCSVSSIQDIGSNCNYYSETYLWAGNFWCLSLKRSNEQGVDYLSVYMYCQGKTPNRKCLCEVEISLINQSAKPNKSLQDTNTFDQSLGLLGIGYQKCLDWNSLLNPDSGFVKEDSIVLMVKIQLQDT